MHRNILRLTLTAVLVLATSGAAEAQVRSGLTWSKTGHSAAFSTDSVTCNGCNAYQGDTSCATALPILCLQPDGAPNPGVATNFSNGWAGGFVYLTAPVPGVALGSLTNANAICAARFGAGYRMAEFHDGAGGWGWQAYGNLDGASRFWVHINDQSANCWN